MARILYGVADEGFGHSSRSHVIGQHLIDGGHDVVFAASRKSLSYLRNPFGGKVKEIAGLSLVYQNGNLLPIHSILSMPPPHHRESNPRLERTSSKVSACPFSHSLDTVDVVSSESDRPRVL